MARKHNLLGSWAFLIGVILAIVLGLIGSMNSTWLFVLVIIGLIVGLFNVGDTEVKPFLFSGVALIIASSFGQSVMNSAPMLNSMLQALLVIFVPATIVVAIKNVFTIAHR